MPHPQDNFLVIKNSSPPGFNILSLMDKKPTKGDVGIEIEMEGRRFIKDNTLLKPFWSYHHDGSLRGEDNAEYVLCKPIKFSQVSEVVEILWELLKGNKASIDESNRTSVHVHLNCQKFHLNRLTSFAALYFCLEEILTEWCGEHRVGNLFCLRAKDAPGIISSFKRFIVADGKSELSSCLHYANFNTNALAKFGSIEIRSMRGATTPTLVTSWVSILERIYTLSESFPDPREICSLFSQQGPLAFFESLLGDWAFVLRQDLSLSDDHIKDSMYEGIRLAQDLCYCRDWDLYKPINTKSDPFNRKVSTLSSQSLGSMTPELNNIYSSYSPGYNPNIPTNIHQLINSMTNTAPQVFTTSIVPQALNGVSGPEDFVDFGDDEGFEPEDNEDDESHEEEEDEE